MSLGEPRRPICLCGAFTEDGHADHCREDVPCLLDVLAPRAVVASPEQEPGRCPLCEGYDYPGVMHSGACPYFASPEQEPTP
ncbi:MAG TPA: hypothetical protein VNJ54_12680 [Plantibacter sp.]|uniref:hypothetical protein n=1 Tax=Plantibacter sp. TaxID=1871045 RepID=UPI002BE1B769|nr:hypothetical protein [Plantibacter sp.]